MLDHKREAGSYVSEVLFRFREDNPGCTSIPLSEFLSKLDLTKVDEAEARSALQHLHSIDVILFYDKNIFFLN